MEEDGDNNRGGVVCPQEHGDERCSKNFLTVPRQEHYLRKRIYQYLTSGQVVANRKLDCIIMYNTLTEVIAPLKEETI